MTASKSLVRRVLGSAGVNLWLSALGLLTTPYLLVHLGQAAYGVFAMVSLVSAHLSNLELGFGHATIRFLARARAAQDAHEERRVLDTSFVVFVSGGVVGSLLFLLAAPSLARSFFKIPLELQPAALLSFRLGALILAASFLSSFFSALLQALGRFDWLNGSRGVFGTAAAFAAVATVAAGGGLVGVMVAQTVIGAAGALILGLGVRRERKEPLRFRLSRPTLRAMAAFSVFAFAAGLAYQWMINGPPVVLAAHVSAAEVPPFSVPHQVLQKLTLLIGSASMAFFPFASAASAGDDRRLAQVFLSHTRLTLLVMGAIVAYLMVFPGPLLTAWIGAEFARAAAPCLSLLALAALVLALSGPPADVARGLGHPSWVLVYTAFVAGLGLATSFWLVGPYRATGAALALLTGVVAGTLPFFWVVARRLLRLRAKSIVGGLGPPVLAVLVLVAFYTGVSRMVGGLVPLLALGALGTSVFAILVYGLVLDSRERGVLRRAAGLP